MRLLPFLGIVALLVACGLTGGGDDKPDIPGKIVFSAEDGAGASQIYTMNADGSDLKQLTHWESSSVQPSWSPDGTRIIFSSFKLGSSIGPALWVMNADGSKKQPLRKYEDYAGALEGRNARWSPDGSKVAYDICLNCQLSTNYHIYVFDTQTKTATRLTDTDRGVINTNPVWSPDGNRIAFNSNRAYYDADTLRYRKDLYVISADGTNLQRLTHTGNATEPVWRPDGKKIAYEWKIQGNNIFIYQIGSGKIIEVQSGLEYAGNPLWNEDGTQLLVFGRETEQSAPEVRLIALESDSFKILQSFTLDKKAIGKNYNWHINKN